MRRFLAFGLMLGALSAALAGAVLAQTQWPEVQGRGICYTEIGWCPLADPERTPTGVRCYCILGDRYIYGVTSSYRYWGRVNPYFNPHPPPVPTTIK